jgi:hypothetical protein
MSKYTMTNNQDSWMSRALKLETALRGLSNEVLASLPLMEPLCRREFGNTNYNLLIERAEYARKLLDEGRK